MDPTVALIRLGGVTFEADPSGALWWPAERILFVADLHLEKGSSYARRGILLPPYDTRATLDRLRLAIEKRRPARVMALGDSFHDAEGKHRLDPEDRARLEALMGHAEFVWIAGNHDDRTAGLERIERRGIEFRHEAGPNAGPQVSGHYHPKATLRVHGRSVTCRCFVGDGRRLILPAFGAYAGGLDVCDPAIAGWFPGGFTAHLTGLRRITAVPSSVLGVSAALTLSL
jgi:DNA ligase-associated metallophosphoesterase